MKTFRTTLLLISLFILTGQLQAQSIIRGPYLQSVNQESIIIRWRTNSSTTSKVWYGSNPNSLNSTTTSGGTTTEHEVNVSGLSPNTVYYYAVGNNNGPIGGGDSNHYFRTSPTGPIANPINIWVLGDAGKGDQDQRDVRDAFYAYHSDNPVELTLLLGDNAYDDGTDEEFQVGWFENMYEDRLINSPMFSCYGNHDANSANSSTETGPYFDIFNFPKNGECGGVPSNNEDYFSHDYGDIHIISLNSYDGDRTVNGAQLQWLEQDLIDNDKNWTIVMFHYPAYDGRSDLASDANTREKEMRQNAVPIMEEYGVDLVLAGHSHTYQRSFLIDNHYGVAATFDPNTMGVDMGDGRLDGDGAYQKNSDNRGVVYMVTGTAGSLTGDQDLLHPVMYYSALTLGSVHLRINHDQLDATFISDSGSIDDYFTIKKDLVPVGPTVFSITNPSQPNYPAPQPLIITTDLDDSNNELTQVQFFINNNFIGTATSIPFLWNWNIPSNGDFQIKAVATTTNGAEYTDVVNISVGPTFHCSAIATSSDDAEQRVTSGTMKISSSDLELVNDGSDQLIGLRFKNINIPKGSVIHDGYIQFTTDNTDNINPTVLKLYGEDSDNAPTYSTTPFMISNRPKTSAVVNWSPPIWTSAGEAGPGQQTPNLAPLLQEIVNRNGYTNQSAVAFIIDGTGKRVAISYDEDESAAPILCVEYTPPYQSDTDGDGTLDGDDLCNSGLEPGANCNDNNPATYDDVIASNCNCEGTPYDCPLFLADIGTPCNDENPGTFNDLLDANCNCTGTSYDCPTYQANFGALCNDNDPSTFNDYLNESCNCVGTPLGPVTTITTTIATSSDDAEEKSGGSVKLTSSDLELVEDGSLQTVGLRFLNVAIPTGAFITDARIQFTVDKTNNINPCLLNIYGQKSVNPGTFLDVDYNISSRPKTVNSVSWSPTQWQQTGAAGLNQQTENLKVLVQEMITQPGYTPNGPLAFLIEGIGQRVAVSFDGNSSEAAELIISYAFACLDDDEDGICNQDDLCPNGPEVPGTSCNDNNPNTFNDIITSSCICEGTPWDCPSLFANIGEACNDNNAGTYNDVINANCNCVGTPFDCPNLNANFGDSCNDGNAATFNDVIQSDCICAGEINTYDCPVIFLNFGDPCDDQNPNTFFDQVTSDCDCAGESSTINTVSTTISQKSDDAEEEVLTGNVNITSSDLELMIDGTELQIVGLRFANVEVPAGAMISNAYIQFTADESDNINPSTIQIYGEAADDALTFQKVDFNISTRAKTNASTTWYPASPWIADESNFKQKTINISALVQEIVNRPGYNYNNAISILMEGTGIRVAKSYDGSPLEAAKLVISFGFDCLDDDNDGLCNQFDPCPDSSANPGTPCDDGNENTFGDVIDENCNCTGLVPTGNACVKISTATDDAEERSNGDMKLSSGDLELVQDGTSVQKVGLRFTGLNIPQGAVITNANIQFTVDEVKNLSPCYLTIYGEASDNAGTYTATDFGITNRLKTTASVAWSPVEWLTQDQSGAAQQTTDISAIIQEIVNRPGYSINSAIGIIIEGEGTRTAEAYEGGANKAAELCVEFDLESAPFAEADLRSEDRQSSQKKSTLKELIIYPNPAKDYLTLVFEAMASRSVVQLEIMDINGKILLSEKRVIENNVEQLTVEGLNLNNGVYFIRLQDEKRVSVAEFVILK